jgi:hypothetical protein
VCGVTDVTPTRGVGIALEWTPTLRQLERGVRARRRATRVAWLEWGLGAVAFLVFLPGALNGESAAWPGLVISVLYGTGLWGFGYRWLFYWRRHPDSFAPDRMEVAESGIVDAQAGVTQRFEWNHWRALLHYRDGLLLMTSTKGDAGVLFLPSAAAVNADEWSEVRRRSKVMSLLIRTTDDEGPIPSATVLGTVPMKCLIIE